MKVQGLIILLSISLLAPLHALLLTPQSSTRRSPRLSQQAPLSGRLFRLHQQAPRVIPGNILGSSSGGFNVVMTRVLPFASSPLHVQAIGVNMLFAALIKLKGTKSLTNNGLFHSCLLGVGLWSTMGFPGWAYGVVYFILGSLVTRVKMDEKKALGIAEKRDGARGPENVWGSAGTSMLCALAIRFLNMGDVMTASLKVAFTAAMATKLSDTFGSEIGKAYGKTCYLITDFKLVPRGTEGAVSLEGTLAGVIASIIMAYASKTLGLISCGKDIAAVLVSAFVATTAESYIGAIFQDSVPWLTNELVNFINTTIGAVVAFLLVAFFR